MLPAGADSFGQSIPRDGQKPSPWSFYGVGTSPPGNSHSPLTRGPAPESTHTVCRAPAAPSPGPQQVWCPHVTDAQAACPACAPRDRQFRAALLCPAWDRRTRCPQALEALGGPTEADSTRGSETPPSRVAPSAPDSAPCPGAQRQRVPSKPRVGAVSPPPPFKLTRKPAASDDPGAAVTDAPENQPATPAGEQLWSLGTRMQTQTQEGPGRTARRRTAVVGAREREVLTPVAEPPFRTIIVFWLWA